MADALTAVPAEQILNLTFGLNDLKMIKAFFTYLLLLLSHVASSDSYPNGKIPLDIEEENVIAHCDNNFYICGQIIWFKLYVTEPQSYKLQSLSKTGYAELTGPDGMTVLQAKIELQNGMGAGSFLIPENAKSGNYELRAYTNRMKMNPSSIFKKSITIANTHQTFDTTAFLFLKTDSLSTTNETKVPLTFNNSIKPNINSSGEFPLNLRTDKNFYRPRSLVNLEVQSAKQEEDITANFSVAVYKLNELTAPEGFLMNSRTITSSPQEFLQDGQVFLPEMDGFVMVAGVKDEAGNPVSKVPLIISLTGKLADVRYGISDEKGFAYFNFKHVYGPQQILIKTAPDYIKPVRVEILKSFMRPQKTVPLPVANFKEAFLEIVEEMHNHLEVTKAFYSKDRDQFLPENKDSISFYGKADAVYLLEDFKRFVTMEEVLREYVQEVSIRIRNKEYFILIWNKQLSDLNRHMNVNPFMKSFPPLILIDGVPVTANELMKYDPLKIRKLEVLGETYFLGQRTYDGILSFTTYEGSFPELELRNNELISDEPGWQFKRKFFVPDYNDAEVRNNRKADFRELLYWNPQIKTGKDSPARISFYTGDLTGEFIVEVHGITSDGRIIHEISKMEVKE